MVAQRQEDGFTYDWEAKRNISRDLELDCNFHLDTFPAVLSSKLYNTKILISGPDLYKLMEEIADRFNMKVVEIDTTETL